MENLLVDLFRSIWQLIWTVLQLFSPVLIGLILAYLINGPAEWLRSKLFKQEGELLSAQSPKGRVPSILLTYLVILLLLALIIFAFIILITGAIPSDGLYATGEKVYEYFQGFFDDAIAFLNKYIPAGAVQSDFNPSALITQWLEDKFSLEKMMKVLGSFVGGIVNFFIGVVASIYLVKDKEFFLTLWQKFLSLIFRQRIHGEINETLGQIHQIITTFIKGAMIDSIIVALLTSIMLSVLKVRFAVILGIIGGLLNIIPYFGPFLGMLPAVLLSLFSGGIVKALLVGITLFIIQQLDSNYIYPKVVGTSIGLHPVFVLISVTVAGHFGGIVGMLLAVPVAGVIQVLIKKWAYSV